MNAIQQLITEHMDIWTAADTAKRSGRGRASSNAGSVYGVKKLRELILELAVRGKLVPQDANDEPASELLKRIQAEKARLITEGKLKKEKALAPISEDEKQFKLTVGWEFVRVGSLLDQISNGYTGSQSKNKTEYPLTRIETISKAAIDFNKVGYCENITNGDIEKYKLVFGDILMSHINSDFHLGKTAVYEDESLLIHGTNLLLLRPSRFISYKYLHTFFTNKRFSGYFFGIAQHAIGQSSVNQSKISQIIISLPPLAEQHRIVAKVDELMALCDQLEAQHSNAAEAHQKLVSHLLGTLTQAQTADDFSANWQRISAHFDTLFTTEASIDALKQTLLQLAVMGKLVPQDANDEPASELLKRIQAEKAKLVAEGKIKKDKPLAAISDDEKPFELPNGWRWMRLDELAAVITKGSSPKWQGVSYSENPKDVMFVTSENVGSYTLLLDSPKYVEMKFNDIEPRSILKNGDFLMNIVGASIGRTAVFNLDTLANINQAVCLIRVLTSNLVSMFLLHFFNSETCLEYMFDKQVDNARPNLSMGNIAKFLIPIPPLAEQHRIVAKVDALMTLCDQLKTSIQQASQQQQIIANVLVAQAVA